MGQGHARVLRLYVPREGEAVGKQHLHQGRDLYRRERTGSGCLLGLPDYGADQCDGGRETKTTLTIDTDDELNSIVIKNEKPFETLGAGSHKAQFEGQTITLTAKVTKTDETTAVNMGTVEFYRQVTGENDTTSWVSIGTAKLEDGALSPARPASSSRCRSMSPARPRSRTRGVFKAVYVQNVTYKTSESANSEAYIKSAQLQIPVIADVDTPHRPYGQVD